MQFQYNTVGGGTNSDDWTRRAWNPQYHAIDGFALVDSPSAAAVWRRSIR